LAFLSLSDISRSDSSGLEASAPRGYGYTFSPFARVRGEEMSDESRMRVTSSPLDQNTTCGDIR